jgi:hypothetical protein
MVLRKLLHRIVNMCNPAWHALRGTLMLSCTMVFCAFIILVEIGPVSIDTYNLYLCARELATAPAGLLLVAAIGTVCLEEQAG